MLAWPIFHVTVFWGIVNFNALSLTFTTYQVYHNRYVWVGLENFRRVFVNIATSQDAQRIIINSLGFFPLTSLISLPIALFSAYFFFKKIPLAGAFRVIFFLPNIIPIVILAMVYRFSFDPLHGIVNPIFEFFGARPPNWFGEYPLSMFMIYLYCIWAGIGFNCVLLSGAMGRLPQDVFEYNRLEGVGFVRELFQVVIPLVWPTITTTFILGMTTVFTVMLQPYMIMVGGDRNTLTISLAIFQQINRFNPQGLPYWTAFGLTLSLIGLPFILLTRFIMERFFRGVEF